MRTYPCPTDSRIDSRDVIERIEELQFSLESHEEDPEGGHWSDEEARELAALLALQEEAQESPDWLHGETLISVDSFVEYIQELIADCYELPKGVDMDAWPYRHMQFDYEAAADEAAHDYFEVSFSGCTFLIRA